MANIGDKFIITIGDKAKNEQSGAVLYRIKGFKSLVFDENGIEKLEKYKENTPPPPNRKPIEVGSIVCYNDLWRGVVLDKNLKNNSVLVLNEHNEYICANMADIYDSGVVLNGTQFVMESMLDVLRETIKDWGKHEKDRC